MHGENDDDRTNVVQDAADDDDNEYNFVLAYDGYDAADANEHNNCIFAIVHVFRDTPKLTHLFSALNFPLW